MLKTIVIFADVLFSNGHFPKYLLYSKSAALKTEDCYGFAQLVPQTSTTKQQRCTGRYQPFQRNKFLEEQIQSNVNPMLSYISINFIFLITLYRLTRCYQQCQQQAHYISKVVYNFKVHIYQQFSNRNLVSRK